MADEAELLAEVEKLRADPDRAIAIDLVKRVYAWNVESGTLSPSHVRRLWHAVRFVEAAGTDRVLHMPSEQWLKAAARSLRLSIAPPSRNTAVEKPGVTEDELARAVAELR